MVQFRLAAPLRTTAMKLLKFFLIPSILVLSIVLSSCSSYEASTEEGLEGSDGYQIAEGYLYLDGELVFDKKLFELVLAGDFGQSYHTRLSDEGGPKTFGPNVEEWFRFAAEGDLFIFLMGKADCGQCGFVGPYLVIDETSGEVQMHSDDLPGGSGDEGNLFLNTGTPYAIHVVYEYSWSAEEGSDWWNEQIYLYDFSTLKSTLLYSVPEEQTLVMCEMVCGARHDTVEWLNDETVQLNLFDKQESLANEGHGFSIEPIKSVTLDEITSFD
jgi:hypothetical protein